MLIDAKQTLRERVHKWSAPGQCPRIVSILLFLLIVFGLALPGYDAIRFAGKYAILCACIAVALKHARKPGHIFAKHWLMVACAFMLWIIGFSANYISECMSGRIGTPYHTVHDLAYLYEHILLLCVAILASADEEQPADIGFLAIGLLLLAVLHRYALAKVSDPFVGGSSFIHLAMCLTMDDLIVVALLLALCLRIYSSRSSLGGTLYTSLFGCVAVYTIAVTSYLCGGYSPWFLPTWLQTFLLTDAPELAFLLLASGHMTIQRHTKTAPRHALRETVALTVSTALPTVTTALAILIASTPGNLAVGASVGLISIAVGAAQYYYKHYVTQSMLLASLRITEQLEELSLNDPVTGTYNRRWFNQALALGCKGATEGKPNIAVVMIDVDYFKGYNDTLGHGSGDLCLRAVSEAIQSCLNRDRDAVARYGGDELAVILFQTGAAGATGIAERMRRAVWELDIAHPANPHGRVSVSLGVGVAGTTPNLIEPVDLLSAADAALYESKALGRNTVSIRETIAGGGEGGTTLADSYSSPPATQAGDSGLTAIPRATWVANSLSL